MKTDLKRLGEMAYHRVDWSGDSVRAFHRLRKKAGKHPDFGLLEEVYAWILLPFTLWAIDFHALFQLLHDRIETGSPIETDLRLLVETLPPLPDERAQQAAIQHEHEVQNGTYESLILSQHKFDAMELELSSDPAFQREWQEIKRHFSIEKFQDHKQIVRRRMVTERSMRNNLAFQWDTEAGRFREIFDAFCQRWNLYGMRGDTPLLLKLTANLTPFGTMVFIPAYWSFDPKRDVNWTAITNLHNARGVRKQGPKLAAGRAERIKEANKLWQLDREAVRLKLKGDKKHAFLCEGLGWVPETSPKRLRRLRMEFEERSEG
jgi:hypothetical protein